MQKLFEGVFLLYGQVVGRPLTLTYLHGDRASLLLDTGCAGDPHGFITEQIGAAGGDPSALTWIVNTHSDLDHTGGNHAMKQIAPRAMLACGDADREAIEDPAVLLIKRYDHYRADHGIFYNAESQAWILAQSGAYTPVDLTFTGGEMLRLSDDWTVEIVMLTGHAKGHIGILDRKNRALYGGDAIQGSVYLGLDGTPKLCPTYLHVDDYLNTIRLIEHLPIDTYVGCHWSVKHGDAVRDFCAESREFVRRAENAVLASLADQPRTLREIILQIAPSLGDWEHTPAQDLELVFALEGHVSQLTERGKLIATRSAEGILRYGLS
jgi:glyoxylase-like metal-dependent hydrolase (beta-lactamase superfamily II)